MRKTLFVLFMFILLFGIVGAVEESLGEVKLNDCITLKQTCANCSYVNISAITYPNKTTIRNEWNMTREGVMFTYVFCGNSILGEMIVDGHGDVDGIDTVFGYNYEVTRTGTKQSTAQATSSLSFLIIMIILMILFGGVGLKLLKNDYLWILGIFFIFLSILLVVYNTYLGYEYHLLLTGMPESNTPQIIFYIFMTLLLSGLFATITLLFLHWKKIFRYMKREIKRKESNYDDVEDWDYENWAKGHELREGYRLR
ncbi:MAG: hypothetical protein ACFFHD_05660 [Promethearchaeota archaeon]